MENQSSEGRFLWPGVAIVCACIVGAGVYFGLKDSAPAPASSPATGSPAPSSYSQADTAPLAAPSGSAPGNDDTQGVVVYVTRSGKKYHRASCSYLRKSKTRSYSTRRWRRRASPRSATRALPNPWPS